MKVNELKRNQPSIAVIDGEREDDGTRYASGVLRHGGVPIHIQVDENLVELAGGDAGGLLVEEGARALVRLGKSPKRVTGR